LDFPFSAGPQTSLVSSSPPIRCADFFGFSLLYRVINLFSELITSYSSLFCPPYTPVLSPSFLKVRESRFC
jgi:hypothetical protein